ncbi:MAG: DUF6799 domain-containing protein [Brumimicrobium sp.]
MKKLILVFTAIVITASAYALNDSTNKKTSPLDLNNIQNQNFQNDTIDKKYPDGVIMHNGQVMEVKNGEMTLLDRDITMNNGTRVMRDGTFTEKDGVKIKMKDGQHIDMKGNITHSKTTKSSKKPIDSGNAQNKVRK